MEAGGRLHPSMPALQWLELGVGLELSFLYISICYLCSRRALIFLSRHSCLDSLIVGMRSDRSELRRDKSCTASAGQRNMLGAKSANSEAAVNRIYMQDQRPAAHLLLPSVIRGSDLYSSTSSMHRTTTQQIFDVNM